MQQNVAGWRRNIKNIAHNYSEAQKKVREATSNDPWGPSSTLMAEIADLTYNVIAFTEIMQMIWKRLNDHGKNWRHVYKALVLLDYLIKTGNEKVALQCKENIFAIETLKEFNYLEEGKDQGNNVREKAKQLVNLLSDEERLKNERARALKAKERFAQTASGISSDGASETPTSPRYPAFRWNDTNSNSNSPSSGNGSVTGTGELEHARPQTAGEEELQLQLALAMSREEAEQDAARRRSDQVRLQLALSQSQNDFQVKPPTPEKRSHITDLLDVSTGDLAAAAAPIKSDPWGDVAPVVPTRPPADPWNTNTHGIVGSTSPPPLADPWSAPPKITPWSNAVAANTANNNILETDLNVLGKSTARDPWAPIEGVDDTNNINNNSKDNDPFSLSGLGDTLLLDTKTVDTVASNAVTSYGGAVKRTPQSFLGENSSLVNLDNLVTPPKATNNLSSSNPLLASAGVGVNAQQLSGLHSTSTQRISEFSANASFNPFADTLAPRPPSINQMKQQQNQVAFGITPVAQSTAAAPDPWAPLTTTQFGNNMTNASPWTISNNANQQPNPFFS